MQNRLYFYSLMAGAIVAGFAYSIPRPLSIRNVMENVKRHGQAIEYFIDGKAVRSRSRSFGTDLEIIVFEQSAKEHLAVRSAKGEIIDLAPPLKFYADGEIDHVKGVKDNAVYPFQSAFNESISSANAAIAFDEAQGLKSATRHRREADKRYRTIRGH